MKRFHALRTRLFGAAAALMVVAVAGASAQWVAGADAPPSPDYWAFADAYHNGTVYTFGGASNGRLQNGIHAYSIAGDQWTSKGNLFAAMYFSGAATIDDKIYVVGGQTGNGNANYLDGMSVFDAASGSMTAGASMPMKVTQTNAVAADGKLYVVGGRAPHPTQANADILMSDVLVYTPGGSWQTISNSLPLGLTLTQVAAEGNTIYVAGGLTVSSGQLVIVNVAYKGTVNGSTISWTPIANLPTGIYGGDMTMLDGRPLIAGGANGSDGYRNAYLYNPQSNQWESFYQTPYSALQGRVSGDGSMAVLIGGGEENATHTASLSEGVAVASFASDRILVTSQGNEVITRQIAVGNGGLAELQVTGTVPAEAEDWLSVTGATVAPSQTGNINFSINTNGLEPGVYSTVVTLEHNDEQLGPYDVDVLLYVGEVVEQDIKAVIEEASGDWCGWCPDGARVLEELEQQFGDDIVILSYHGGSASEPLAISGGTQILSMLGISGYPSAAIQRILFSGESAQLVSRSRWAAYTEAVLTGFDHAPVALVIDEYAFDPETRKVSASLSATTAEWLSADVSELKITAVITQMNIYTRQVDYVQNTTHQSYHQKHAVRQVWPSPAGSSMPLSEGTVVEGYATPGRTGTLEVEFTVPESSGIQNIEIKPEDAKITFLVHTGTTQAPGMILQAVERELVSETVSTPSISVDFGNVQTKEINAEETAAFEVTVTNNRSEPTVVTLTRATNTMPSGWMSEICTGESDCDDADVTTFTIAADASHTFNLKVYGATADKTGRVRLVVASSDVSVQEDFTVNTKISSVKVAGERDGLKLASVTPNPASTVARVEVTLPTTARTTLEVYTTTGEKVATLFEGRLESGTRSISADVTGLESGKYVLVLTAGETKVSRTLTVVR